MAATPVSLRTRTAPRVVRVRKRASELLFVAPIVLIVGIAIGVPVVSVIHYAFTRWNPGFDSPWVGLENFTTLFASEDFRQVLVNQAFLLLGLPLWVLLPLAVAFLLYEGVPGAGGFRTLFFFASTASPALVGVLFVFMLSPSGPLNEGLRSAGLDGLAHNWLSEPNLVKPVLIFVLAWATLGTGVLLYSAALSAVPVELFEAAQMDGASWWQRLRYVVLPSVAAMVELWTVILVITVFVAIFPWIFTMTRGGPGYSSTTLDFDIYQNALTLGNFGLAAAEAVVLFVTVLVILLAGMLVSRRLGYRHD